jgi:hypothetical protein
VRWQAATSGLAFLAWQRWHISFHGRVTKTASGFSQRQHFGEGSVTAADWDAAASTTITISPASAQSVVRQSPPSAK